MYTPKGTIKLGLMSTHQEKNLVAVVVARKMNRMKLFQKHLIFSSQKISQSGPDVVDLTQLLMILVTMIQVRLYHSEMEAVVSIQITH